MFLQTRKILERIRRIKKQLVAGACHLRAAEVSFLSVVIFLCFVLSTCLCMMCIKAFCLRSSKMNRTYSEDKVHKDGTTDISVFSMEDA